MADIPEWAIERAHSAVKVEGGVNPRFESYTRQSVPVLAFARYIASKEEPPIDPLLIEARELVSVTEPNVNIAINIRRGMFDDGHRITLALAGIKRGMELAGPAWNGKI